MRANVKVAVLEELGTAIDWRGVIDPSPDVLNLHHEAASSSNRVRILSLDPQVLFRNDWLLNAYVGCPFDGCLGEGRPVKRGGLLVKLEEVRVMSNADICRIVLVKVAIVSDAFVASCVLIRTVVCHIFSESRLHGLISWGNQLISVSNR